MPSHSFDVQAFKDADFLPVVLKGNMRVAKEPDSEDSRRFVGALDALRMFVGGDDFTG